METIFEIVRIKQEINEVEVNTTAIRSPENAYEFANQFIGDDDREVFFVMCLNTKHNVVAVHRAHVGALNQSIVHPREVFKSAILNNSYAIIVAHQHPSGSTEVSPEDINVTKQLILAGKTLKIEVLDHIIIGRHNFVSLREKGYIS